MDFQKYEFSAIIIVIGCSTKTDYCFPPAVFFHLDIKAIALNLLFFDLSHLRSSL